MDDKPATDERHPAQVVSQMVEHVLSVADTWTRWDGRPQTVAITGEPSRVYTPNKAIRRITDHLIDHLAEIDARLSGRPPEADGWHASAVTTPADLAAFGVDDLNEARNRLRRLALMYEVRLTNLTDQVLDTTPGGEWSIRQVVFNVGKSAFYADLVGRLS